MLEGAKGARAATIALAGAADHSLYM